MPRTSQAEWLGTPSIRGSSEPVRMALLTFSLIGLQLTWGLEQTYCTPYLLSLGLTKSFTSLVWIAGPLSGLLMQPIVGAISDRCTSKYGRRRPFMIGGSAITSMCLLLLGWTKETVSFTMGETDGKSRVVVVMAGLWIYVLDFAINAVQACCRGIIVDVLPISQQQTGSAWAARMAAAGHVIGFVIGSLDLVNILPNWLGGDTQFKKMCLVASVGLWLAVGLTCWAVHEHQLLRPPVDESSGRFGFGVLKSLWLRMWNLPDRIRMICWCQFWGWIGWFPFLFYCSTWVGETYYRYEHPELASTASGSSSTPAGESSSDTLGNIGRLGSVALVLFSTVTLTSSVLLPYLVLKPEENASNGPKSSRGRFTPRPPPSLGKEVQKVLMRIYESPRPDLVTTWGLSNLTFAAIMVWAPFVRSLRFATTLVALCGIPWAVSCWAPFAEMGVEINRLASGGGSGVLGASGTLHGYRAVDDEDSDDDDVELQSTAQRNVQNEVPGHRVTSSGSTGVLHLNHDEGEDSSTGELAGVYLGVLNVYTTLPQFVGTFISWIVFSILEPSADSDGRESGSTLGKKLEGVNSIAVCLFIGAICAIVAAEATRRLKKITPGIS